MSKQRELCEIISKIWFHAITPEGKQILYGIYPETVAEIYDLWYSPLGQQTCLGFFPFCTAMLRDELEGKILTEFARHYQFERAWKELAHIQRESASADSRDCYEEGSV